MTQPVPMQPGATQPKEARQSSGGRETSRGRGGADRSPTSEGPRSPWGLGRWGSLSGGLGVGIIAVSAVAGAIATAATRTQPGQVLSVSVVVGTFVAALAVRPNAGRLIFPAPVLFYLIAALAAGIFYDRSASKTQQAVDAAQWIANGFFAMAIATGLAIVLITVRWYLWRRRKRTGGDMRNLEGRGSPGPQAARPAQPPLPGQSPQGPDQRPGWQTDHYQGPTGLRPGAGPYNFSSGA